MRVPGRVPVAGGRQREQGRLAGSRWSGGAPPDGCIRGQSGRWHGPSQAAAVKREGAGSGAGWTRGRSPAACRPMRGSGSGHGSQQGRGRGRGRRGGGGGERLGRRGDNDDGHWGIGVYRQSLLQGVSNKPARSRSVAGKLLGKLPGSCFTQCCCTQFAAQGRWQPAWVHRRCRATGVRGWMVQRQLWGRGLLLQQWGKGRLLGL